MLQICENIRQQRVLAKKTQQQIADFLKVNRSTYANWESNIEPDIDTIKKIANFLDIKLSILLSEPNDKNLAEEDPEQYITVTRADAGKEIGYLKEKNIMLAASLAVLEQMIDKLVSDQTGHSIALVAGERKQATEMEAKRLFSAERKKHKQA